MKKKFIVSALSLAMITGLLSGCGGTAEPETTAQKTESATEAKKRRRS